MSSVTKYLSAGLEPIENARALAYSNAFITQALDEAIKSRPANLDYRLSVSRNAIIACLAMAILFTITVSPIVGAVTAIVTLLPYSIYSTAKQEEEQHKYKIMRNLEAVAGIYFRIMEYFTEKEKARVTAYIENAGISYTERAKAKDLKENEEDIAIARAIQRQHAANVVISLLPSQDYYCPREYMRNAQFIWSHLTNYHGCLKSFIDIQPSIEEAKRKSRGY